MGSQRGERTAPGRRDIRGRSTTPSRAKDELFHSAVEGALDTFGARLDELTVGLDDPPRSLPRASGSPHACTAESPEIAQLGTAGSRHGRRDIDAAVHTSGTRDRS